MKILTVVMRFIMVPLILVLLGLIISWKIKFNPVLSKGEQEMQTFSYEKVNVIPDQPAAATKGIDSPLPLEIKVVVPSKKDFPKVPLSDMTMLKEKKKEEPAEILQLSMILSKKGRRTAMINGLLVSEGDYIKENRIEKIENNRVLIKSKKGERWISM